MKLLPSKNIRFSWGVTINGADEVWGNELCGSDKMGSAGTQSFRVEGYSGISAGPWRLSRHPFPCAVLHQSEASPKSCRHTVPIPVDHASWRKMTSKRHGGVGPWGDVSTTQGQYVALDRKQRLKSHGQRNLPGCGRHTRLHVVRSSHGNSHMDFLPRSHLKTIHSNFTRSLELTSLTRNVGTEEPGNDTHRKQSDQILHSEILFMTETSWSLQPADVMRKQTKA